MPDEPKPQPPPQLTGVRVAGFKSLVRMAEPVEFRPLTLLAGANSSGKSSLMQAILLLKQTLEVSYDPGALLLDGPNVRFSSAEQMFSKLGKGKAAEMFAIELVWGGGSRIQWEFGRHSEDVIELRRFVSWDDGKPTELRRGMSSEEIKAVLPARWAGESASDEKLAFSKLNWQVLRERCGFYLGAEMPGGGVFDLRAISTYFDKLLGTHSNRWEGFLRGVVHLPGLRGNPRRDYPVAAVGRDFPGTFEAYTASIVAKWKAERRTSKLEAVNEDLVNLGLTWKVSSNKVSDTQVELVVGRLPRPARGGAHVLVNIADVGFGVSQTLPVVVALHAAAPGQCVYLEQPEIHLHPKAQIAMAGVLARAIQRGVQVVVETHSSLLLLALQALVAEGREIQPASVKLLWFDRDEQGATFIRSGQLDADGAYGDWPENFGKVEMDLEARYLDAVDARWRANP